MKLNFRLFTLILLLVACGDSENKSAPSQIIYQDSEISHIQFDFPNEYQDQGATLLVGLSEVIVTQTFFNTIGLSSQILKSKDSLYIRPQGIFDPNEEQIWLNVKISFQDKNLDLKDKLIFYHIQKSKTQSIIGYIKPQIENNNLLSFKTKGYGIYQIAKIADILSNSLETQTNIHVFDANSDFILGNWRDPIVTPTPTPTPNPDAGETLPAPASAHFTDEDIDGGELQGEITITPPANDNLIESFIFYWAYPDFSEIPTAFAEITYPNETSYIFQENTSIPNGITRIHVYSKNSEGQSENYRELVFIDKAIPINASPSVIFTETSSAEQLTGNLLIAKAIDESDLDNYKVYWADQNLNKAIEAPLATLNKQDSDLNVDILETIIPNDATNFLVITSNTDGEMRTGANTKFRCDNTRRNPPDCDSCASRYTNYPSCDQCANPKHTGANCGECLPQFDQATYPLCNACSNIYLAEGCNSCTFPNADILQLCLGCINPQRMAPRCVR